VLGPEQLAAAMVVYRDALGAEQATINRLNVFPVPDGDTGTNMLLTLESVVTALADLAVPADMAAVTSVVARAALMGARGNSGVILCQILRGMCAELAPLAKAGSAEIAHALRAGSDGARAAVLEPAEGTILTVAAAAAQAACEHAESSAGLLATVEAAREGALEALWRTPQLLPVLAEAGVVDAGGAGLVLLFDGLLTALDGRPLPGLQLPDEVRRVIAGATAQPSTGALADRARGVEDGGGPLASDRPAPDLAAPGRPATGAAFEGCRYEVMYLLEAADEAIPAFREVWAGLGDSIVVVGGDGLWSCHIHTDEIGAAIEAALDAGRPRQIRVTDLAEQVEEESWVRNEAARAGQDGLEAIPPDLAAAGRQRTTHVVAVASGEGIRRIFRSLGVEGVVAGGQSMNPSTAEVLEMIERSPGKEVVVLPNNSNIVPVAEQAAALSDKHVVVVPTRAIQEGFAALLEYDPETEADSNAERMAEAASRVVTGEVTRAVRAADSAAGPVAAGAFIGLDRHGIVSVSADLAEATCGLLEAILTPAHELVTVFEGAGATAGATRRVSEWLAANRPGVDFERHVGGQPLYPYLVTVE
jgi:DAK2 domain fusion protein YloV